MKNFHRSFICRPTDTGKKGHRNKHSNKNEICKCYAPFLKLHHYDCPVARKPCPIHGNAYRQCVKDEKVEKKENMIISFHPSLKTDKLFRPVKNLLAHCNPETKIHLEYYSPDNSTSKDDAKQRQTKTNPEEPKKTLSSKVFVKKTKSFETDKTNQMRRLKQCFHSPCNSIVGKTKSQCTLTEKIKKNFISEEASDRFYCGKFKWTSSNKLDSSDWEKSSEDKTEPDFVTVTKQSENKVIDHKIFEIKPKKVLGDVRFTKLPREAPFVYSSYDIQSSKKTSFDLDPLDDPPSKQKNVEKYSTNKEILKKTNDKESSSSRKSQSSSSGSVYFTSHIFKLGVKESATDISKYSEDVIPGTPENLSKDKVGGKMANIVNASVQTEASAFRKNTIDSSSEVSSANKSNEFAKKSSPEKTSIAVGSTGISSSMELLYPSEELHRNSSSPSRKNTEFSFIRASQTNSKFMEKSTQVPPSNGIDKYDPREDEFHHRKAKSKSQDSSFPFEETSYLQVNGKKRNSADTRTEVLQKREVALVYDGAKQIADKLVQTSPILTRNVQVETVAPKKNKSQMTRSTKEEIVQTSFALSDSRSQSNEGEYADLDSNVNCLVTSYISSVCSQSVSKCQVKKSHSDGDLFCDTDDSANENGIHFHHFCTCEQSEIWNSEIDLNGNGKISQPKKSNLNPTLQNQIERRPNERKKDATCKGEQTSSLSDLSELAKVLCQILSKTNKETSRESEKVKKDLKATQTVKADSFKSMKKPVDAEAQTTFKITIQEEVNENSGKGKTPQGDLSSSDEEAVIVCKICHRKINRSIDRIGIPIVGQEKPQSPKKEVFFANAGTITEDLDNWDCGILKRSISLSVPEELDRFKSKQKLSVTECLYSDDLNNASATKTLLNKPNSFYTSETNNQAPNDWSINITSLTCSTPSESILKEDDQRLDKFSPKKETTPYNQPNEKQLVRKTQKSSCWKYTDAILTSENFEKKPIPKAPDPCKSTRRKSNIPASTDTFRKTYGYKNNVSATAGGKPQNGAPPGTSRCSKPQKDPCTSTLWIQKNAICFCGPQDASTSNPAAPPVKTNLSTSNKNSVYCDQKPPRPTKLKPGGNSTTNRRNSSETSPKRPGQKKTILYPAIIRPMWYSNFKKTLQMIKNFEGHSLQGSDSNILKQKRCCEGEDDSPGGKKKKGKYNGSGECLDFEEKIFPLDGETIIDMRNKTGFVWIPSSALQISKSETHPMSFLKGSHSESKLTKPHPQNSILHSEFNKKTSPNILPAKSCRLKPVQVNEKHPFRKLFEFRLCKSLNFLKNDQKDFFVNENCTLEYEPCTVEAESSSTENSNIVHWPFSIQIEDKYSEDFPLESSDSTPLSESSDVTGENGEAKAERDIMKILTPPKAGDADSFSETVVTSKSFDTFWFGRNNWKKHTN